MKILLSLAAIFLASGARAAASRTAPELLAHPEIPVYPSPFYAHSDFPQLLPAPLTRDAAPDRSAVPSAAEPIGEAALAPKVSAVSLIAPLPASEIPQAREDFSSGVGGLLSREPLGSAQAGAVASVAKAAFDAKDVDTLAQLALLSSREKHRALHDLLMEALQLMRHRVLTAESVEAERALRTLSSTEPLTDATRTWIAAQVLQRAKVRHLPAPVAP